MSVVVQISGPEARHFVLDDVRDMLHFEDIVRLQDARCMFLPARTAVGEHQQVMVNLRQIVYAYEKETP